MSQSLSELYIHLVFSTKGREPMLADAWRADLHAYLGGIMHGQGGLLLGAGSIADHIHLLVTLPRTVTVADLVQHLKTGSAKWIKSQGPAMEVFHWQAGYGAFSISPSHCLPLKRYLDNQADHHRQESFQDEYRRLLRKYGITIDEKHLWD
jgi:putative transposase